MLCTPRSVYVLLFTLSSIAGLACNSSSGLDPVKGKVLFQGQPLAGALVALHPVEGPTLSTQPVTGLSRDDGSFNLSTGQEEGAAPGKYKVTVTCMVPIAAQDSGKEMTMSMGPPETEDRFKGKYADREKSQIEIEIKAGQTELEPIKLE